VVKVLLIGLSILFYLPAWSLSDCDCEAISCGSCEAEVDIKFYTLKCDGGNRVKSCKKPVCAKVEDRKECRSPASVEPKKEEAPKTEETVVALESVKNSIGIVVVAQGATMVLRQGKSYAAKIGFKVYEKDYIETGADGKIKIKFKDDNVINLVPNSKLTIEELQFDPAKENKKTILNLLYGKVRSSVKQSYNGENYYEVKTKTAVAGVRGTDFVVSYSEDDKVEAKVETISGKVELSDLKKKRKIHVPASTYASFVVEKVTSGVFSENDIANFVAKGYLTPVFKMTQEELQRLEINTNFNQEEAGRGLAGTEVAKEDGKAICSAPKGDFNQCLWTCENNPDKEKRCRTDLPNVNCLRKRCNANGKWAEETRLPAAYFDMCEGHKPIVKACDY
jgi:hypothetical protein